MKQEVSLYNANGVQVTSARFVANGTTFALANISSVQKIIVKADKSMSLWAMVGAIAFGICGCGGLSFTAYDNSPIWRIAGVLGVLGALGLAALWLAIIFIPKDRYAVRIHTNAGESNAFVSTDGSEIDRIVGALNQAIISRG